MDTHIPIHTHTHTRCRRFGCPSDRISEHDFEKICCRGGFSINLWYENGRIHLNATYSIETVSESELFVFIWMSPPLPPFMGAICIRLPLCVFSRFSPYYSNTIALAYLSLIRFNRQTHKHANKSSGQLFLSFSRTPTAWPGRVDDGE